MNIQECDALIQVSSVAKSEEINNKSHQKVAPIELHVTMTDDPMVVLRAKSTQQYSSNIILWAAVYDAVRKRTVIPIQDMNK